MARAIFLSVGSVTCTVMLSTREVGGLPGLAEQLVARGRRVVAEAWPVGKLVTHAVALAPSTLVLVGRLSGVELREVAVGIETEPGMAVLVVAPLRPRIEVMLALASGVSGYLPPESDPEVVADALSALCAGELVVPREALTLMADQLRVGRGVTVEGVDGRPVELTHREWEVLVLIRQAYSTAEIARRLVVASVTVRSHVAALVHKLGVHDRTVLAEPPDTPQPGR